MFIQHKYGNFQKEKAYRNAITCLYNGLDKSAWNSCSLSWYDADEVWEEAEKSFYIMCKHYAYRKI